MPRPYRSTKAQVVGLFVSFLLVILVALVGNLATGQAVREWYPGLEKPALTPPGWVFGPVWTVLYAAMATAAWLVWRSGPFEDTRVALGVYGVHLVFNAAWSVVFFGAKAPGPAVGVILVLFVLILATIVLFRRHDRLAAWLLVPYLLWVGFASYLNIGIWMLN